VKRGLDAAADDYRRLQVCAAPASAAAVAAARMMENYADCADELLLECVQALLAQHDRAFVKGTTTAALARTPTAPSGPWPSADPAGAWPLRCALTRGCCCWCAWLSAGWCVCGTCVRSARGGSSGAYGSPRAPMEYGARVAR
jgi:hypothetical protein